MLNVSHRLLLLNRRTTQNVELLLRCFSLQVRLMPASDRWSFISAMKVFFYSPETTQSHNNAINRGSPHEDNT